MSVSFDEINDWVIARPEFTRLDALAAKEFQSAMTDHCSGANRVVLDLANVTFIDSRGLATLVSIFKILASGGTLRLANVSSQVQVLLTLTRLNTLFPAFGSVEEAVDA